MYKMIEVQNPSCIAYTNITTNTHCWGNCTIRKHMSLNNNELLVFFTSFLVNVWNIHEVHRCISSSQNSQAAWIFTSYILPQIIQLSFIFSSLMQLVQLAVFCSRTFEIKYPLLQARYPGRVCSICFLLCVTYIKLHYSLTKFNGS